MPFLKTRVISTRPEPHDSGANIEIEKINFEPLTADLRASPLARHTALDFPPRPVFPNLYFLLVDMHAFRTEFTSNAVCPGSLSPFRFRSLQSATCQWVGPRVKHSTDLMCIVHRSAPRVCVLPDVDGQYSTTSCSCTCCT